MTEVQSALSHEVSNFDPTQSPEVAKVHGTGIIFHILPTDEFMFFRRSNNPDIPFPGRIALIGGRCNPDEPAEDTIRREVKEELFYSGTNKSFILEPGEFEHVATIQDDRPGEVDVFSYEFDHVPDLYIKEGKGLVILSREETLGMDFPYWYTETIHSYVNSSRLGFLGNAGLTAAEVQHA
jgi:8-oxo-dGTP pyrophosphatase MutT (NUDIX family)